MKQEDVVGGCPIYLSTLAGISLPGVPSVPELVVWDSACIYFALYKPRRKKKAKMKLLRAKYRNLPVFITSCHK